MKKLIIIGIVSIIAILGACGEVVKEEVDVKDVGVKEDKVETVNDTNTSVEEVVEEESQSLNQVVVDDELLKIELTSIEKFKDDIFGDSINVNFDVTNKTDKTFTLSSSEVSADGRMVDNNDVFSSLYSDISGGKSGTSTLSINTYNTEIELPELTESLELVIQVFDSETFNTINEYRVLVNF